MNLAKRILLASSMLVAVIAWCVAGVNEPAPKVKAKGERTYMFRIHLRDKTGCGYSIANPLQFLSPKAMERRNRQHLGVDSTDLPVSKAYEQIIEQLGCRVVSRSKWNNTVVAQTENASFGNAVKELPFVTESRLVWTSPDSVEAKGPRPKYHQELTLHDTVNITRYGATEGQLRMLGAQKLHAEGFTGKGMTIVVMDAGFLNADLIPALRDINLVGYADLVCPQSKSIFAEMEHGEQVLSVIAVNVPHVYVGTAPDASFWCCAARTKRRSNPWRKIGGQRRQNTPTVQEWTS